MTGNIPSPAGTSSNPETGGSGVSPMDGSVAVRVTEWQQGLSGLPSSGVCSRPPHCCWLGVSEPVLELESVFVSIV